MTQGHAAGRKTGTAEKLLENQLSVLSTFAAESLAAATALDAADVDQAYRRDSEIAHALSIARATAQLGTALGKLRGEFTHRMIIRREEGPPPPAELPPPDAAPRPPPYEGEPPLFTDAEWDSGTLTNEELWARSEARHRERARRAGWI